MSKISEEKQQKIKEEILNLLFHNSPKSLFTSEIASEIIRDEEFVLKLLKDMKKQKLVDHVKNNNRGYEYLIRRKWFMPKETYSAYKKLHE
jgi:hypothetical protein